MAFFPSILSTEEASWCSLLGKKKQQKTPPFDPLEEILLQRTPFLISSFPGSDVDVDIQRGKHWGLMWGTLNSLLFALK